MQPPAVVMNMFYTGLGIARSLGERRIPVIGLSAEKGLYGNWTRFADVLRAPDSRNNPAELLDFLTDLGSSRADRSVIFPTRDDDIVFLNRYREDLSRYFDLVIPSRSVIQACLDKWETHRWAWRAGVPAPKTWMVITAEDLPRVVDELTFPCVLKPVSSYEWHQGRNWELVGGRKAVGIISRKQFLDEYQAISAAGQRVLVQEMVQGGDDQLFVAACFFNRDSEFVKGFTARKRVQVPEGLGTGCIVETADCPEVLDRARRLLGAMGFSGIAEVEFKRDLHGEYKLIEINARPWDQHRLGGHFGVDLIYLAYCEYAALGAVPAKSQAPARKAPTSTGRRETQKWIAEDAFVMALLRSLLENRPAVASLLRACRGKRIFAIWSPGDPLPFFAWLLGFLWTLAVSFRRYLGRRLGESVSRLFPSRARAPIEDNVYGFERSKSEN